MIIAIVASSLVVTTVMYFLVLLRLGKPLQIEFKGYGLDLKVGRLTVCESSPAASEAIDGGEN